ncbi:MULTISPECIES: DUF916 and DUF3324 domain-containing protein [unclassified Enterococcus]|uniref:DUF916 and DUF3324 domain-containing protein n=1 Tax=unclassified Enterococcus TaxID=2608891 RepID=UPI001CE19B3F|nr:MULTISPECIES: DUF916 and DUF3324 domain-containing protein [unclassified Enterococcus]MCA5014504.1 DUF916 and DUF3324 domain-containing protein [Enterococcus sp. S23]MCA5017382.1 DUF916 and DUF3324 domain-containing protein [Enterococcus sp. S22(2020)]
MLKKVLSMVMLVMGFICISFTGTMSGWAQEAEYEVKAVPSSAQVDTTKTYFDLRLKPEEQHTVKVAVTNRSNEALMIDTAVKTATTNTNGVVEYINSEQNKSVKLPYDLSQLVQTTTKKITLAPHETQNVDYTITMPKQAFSGILSGGLVFTSEDNEHPKDSNADVTINNRFGYVIALVLHGEKEVPSDLQLADIRLGQVNDRNVVFAQLENPEAAYLNRLNLSAKIKKKHTKTVLYETSQNDVQMAPNSQFDYPISLEETAFKPGKYSLTIHAESKGRTWDFEKDFEIKAEEAKQLNDQAYIHKNKTNDWWYLLLVIALLLLLFISYIYRKRQQKINALKAQVEELKRK